MPHAERPAPGPLDTPASNAAGSGPPQQPPPAFTPYARPGWRRRLAIAALAALTAVGVVMLLLHPPGGVQRKRPPPPADLAACGPGQTEGCVGSTTRLLPAAMPGQASAAQPPLKRP